MPQDVPNHDDPIENLYYSMIHIHSGIKLGLEIMIKDLETSRDAIQNDPRKFVSQCLAWSHALTVHHTLEDIYIFPVLDRKMNLTEEKDAHNVVHNALERLQTTLREPEADADPSKFNPDRIREQLVVIKEPLFNHLDGEVEHLKPEEVMKAGVSASEIGDAWKQLKEALRAGMHGADKLSLA